MEARAGGGDVDDGAGDLLLFSLASLCNNILYIFHDS